jgi:methylmalonyl-CoA mutase C-terminal domain/subunit
MNRIKVLIAKPGLDGHDRGAKIVAKFLRDKGMEVIYTGLRQTPETIANTSIQEDVDVIGLSILSGAHLHLCSKLFSIFAEKNATPPPVFLGGIIPEEDIAELQKMGIRDIFPPGTPLENIGTVVERIAASR